MQIEFPDTTPSVIPYLTTGEEPFMDARPFRLTRIKRTSKRKGASIGGNVVEISGYEFPRHIEAVAGSRAPCVSPQVAGSGYPTALDAQAILAWKTRDANGTLVTRE